VLHQAEALRSRNESLTKELTVSRGTARQLRDELAERAEESSATMNQVANVTLSACTQYITHSPCSVLVKLLNAQSLCDFFSSTSIRPTIVERTLCQE
jgi:deoxycytidylate deaminase